MINWVSGGGGTIITHLLSWKEYREYRKLMHREFFLRRSNKENLRSLEKFLEKRGVALERESEVYSKATELTQMVYSLLPLEHFGHEHFKTLRLGGWGGGAAKCSEYDDPVVHLFDFAFSGPRRNYIAILLHETGHSHLALLKHHHPKLYAELAAQYQKMRVQNISCCGIDYLFGEKERADHASSCLDEFAAENYLIYVSQGERFQCFLKGLSPEQQEPWKAVYEVYRESFGGREYR
jgi:hypothetical protein